MEILAYDLYPGPNLDVEYTTLDDLCSDEATLLHFIARLQNDY